MSSLTDALERLGGIANRQQLAELLGISQASFSRLFQASRGEIVQIGRGPAVRYALRGRLARAATPVPVWRVAADRRVVEFGELEALTQGRFLFGGGVFGSLPWFLWGLRPQGFIGRGFARRETGLGLPVDLNAWTDEDILLALARRGEDLPGDLLLGHESLERYLQGPGPGPVTRDDYPRLVLAAMQGELPGSSAGGEQPKFAAALDGAGSVIVKFSPPVAESPAARRWGDLLVCEHLALTVMREHGQAAAESALIEQEGRVLLETRRFDRTPAGGRRAMASGSALGMEFAGVGENWTRLANALLRERRISAQDAETIRLWDDFGAMVGNSDRHLGNVSFLTEDYRHFSLAPAYDMLPMRWAPSAQGELVARNPDMAASSLDVRAFGRAADMAEAFWRAVHGDGRLAGRMAGIAELSLEAVGRVRRQMRLRGAP